MNSEHSKWRASRCCFARSTLSQAPFNGDMATRMGARWHDARNNPSRGMASQASAPTRVWTFRFPRPTRYSGCSTALFGSRCLPHDPVEESAGHPETGSVPAVVAEHVLVQVGLKMLGRDSVVHPAYPT